LRHAAGRWMCPFIEEERKWSTRGQNDAFDPTRTSAVRLALNADSGPTPAKDYCLTSLAGDMRRREFITLLGGAVAVLPVTSRARQRTIPRIGGLLFVGPRGGR
jgi:hypothetical protein